MATIILNGEIQAKKPTDLSSKAQGEFDSFIVSNGDDMGRASLSVIAQSVSLLSQVRTFFDFGAVGDGSTDDAAAIQSALRSGHSIINPRYAVFACGSTISAPNVNTYVRGGVLKFTGGTDGVQLHHTGTYAVDWDDCEIRTTQEKSGNGLSITYTAAVLAANRHEELVRLGDGLQIGGSNATVDGAIRIRRIA